MNKLATTRVWGLKLVEHAGAEEPRTSASSPEDHPSAPDREVTCESDVS